MTYVAESPFAANEAAPDQLVEVPAAIVLRTPCCLSVRSANCGSMIVSGRDTMRFHVACICGCRSLSGLAGYP